LCGWKYCSNREERRMFGATRLGSVGRPLRLPHAFGCDGGQGSKHDNHHRPHQQSTTFDSHEDLSTGPQASSTNGILISHLSNNAIGKCEEYTTKLVISAADLVALKEMSRDNFFLPGKIIVRVRSWKARMRCRGQTHWQYRYGDYTARPRKHCPATNGWRI
jgi:hypothetical protein